MNPPLWHLLQISDVLDLEFASALSESVPVLAWQPQRSIFPSVIRAGHEQEKMTDLSPGFSSPGSSAAPVRVRSLPLLRGFARPPLSYFARTGRSVVERLLLQTLQPERSPLICTVPFFASAAERWPGPVIYWLTDLIAEYSSANRREVLRLDRRLCKAATLVCPNSRRLKQYLVDEAGCDPAKIQIVPNATRASNLLRESPKGPTPLPPMLASTERPVAGVIGNLAGNLDWPLIERIVTLTPWLSWVFVGPTSMPIANPAARRARENVVAHPRTKFVGRHLYGELANFARSFDVALLPYLRCEPTYSGSSTRYYEHLAACRPMIATRGLEELTRKAPLLTLIDTAEQALTSLEILRAKNFDDGLLKERWLASHKATWQYRAETLQEALASRLAHSAMPPSVPKYLYPKSMSASG